MAIELYPRSNRALASNRESASEAPAADNTGCCEADDQHRSLVLTQLDGVTEGFPLTWLYRWQWRKEPSHEILTLTLTEHQVTIHGKHLDRITKHLRSSHGLHLQIKDDRYVSLQRKDAIRISTITITPHPPVPANT